MLEEAKNMAEDALVEAEVATEEATKSKENAENALMEAETANEEAIKARKDAEDALVEAEAANDEAIRSRMDAEKAREEAEASREEAIRANKAKSEFLSNMSHDIRTPMNAIVGMTTIANAHLDDRDRVKDCLQDITLASKQMLSLINDILDMSKIESGKLSINPEPISVALSLKNVSNIIKASAEEKNLVFKAESGDIICENIYCDGTRLNQVMLNLLSNAVKFTPEGGSVNLDWIQEESDRGQDFVKNIITVSDTGIGMSEEFRQKIFEPFEREDNKRVHKIQGTGLGMAITKYIIDAMEGSISVDSRQGKGTTFTVILDIKKSEGMGEAGNSSGSASDLMEDENVDNLDLTGKKILLAEDQKVNAIVASTYLKEIGAEVEIAEDGQIAFDMVEKSGLHEYDAVLMDLRMPNMNGIESTMAIRKLDREDAKNVPIIAMTADAYAEDIKKCLDAGMNAHISKPIDLKVLKKTLKKYLF